MINLLPPIYRQKLKEKEYLRLLFLLGTIFGIALFALSIFLIVIQVALSKEHISQESKLIFLKEQTTKEELMIDEISSWNLKLTNLEKFKQEQISLKDVFYEIEKSLPEDLYLLSFSYTPLIEIKKKDDEVLKTPAAIAVTGSAPVREKLLLFKDALQANPFFTEVVFPPSNWVNQTDIIFSFQAKLLDKQ